MSLVVRLLLVVVGLLALDGGMSAAERHVSPRAVRPAGASALEQPTDVSVVRFKPDVVLHWRHSGRGVTAFEVERAVDGGPFVRTGTVTREARTFRDRTSASGHAYLYRVRAVTLGAASAYSTEILVSVTPGRRPAASSRKSS